MKPGVRRYSALEIKANYSCNTRCIYCCGYNNWRKPVLGYAAIEENIRYFMAEYGIEEVCLSGGEPTIHPDFLKAVRFVREQGLRLYLHTNGLSFARRDFAGECAGLIDRALVGFSYHDEALCAALTGVRNSFARRLDGIANLLAGGIPVRTNTVILRDNLAHLPEIAAIVAGLGTAKALFTLPFFIEATPAQVEQFVPASLDAVMKQLRPAIGLLQERGIAVSLQGLPPCKLGEFAGLYEIDPDRVFVDSEHQFERHSTLFSGKLGYRQVDSCAGCMEATRCWGFPAAGAMGRLGEALGLP